MITVTVSVDIDRPSREVFAYLADVSNNTAWQNGMKSCEWTSPGPIGIGSTYHQVASFLGRTIENDFEVTAFIPDQSITFTSTSGSFPLTVTRSVDKLDVDACRARALIKGGRTGIGGLLDPVTKPLVTMSVNRDYQRLRRVLEAS